MTYVNLAPAVVNTMKLGEWLKVKRTERKLSTRALGALAEISYAQILKIENGESRSKLPTVDRIAEALAGPDATEEERQRLKQEARAAFAGTEEQADDFDSGTVTIKITREPYVEQLNPEGWRDLDDPFVRTIAEQKARQAAQEAAQETYDRTLKSVEDALREARRRDPREALKAATQAAKEGRIPTDEELGYSAADGHPVDGDEDDEDD